MEIWKPVKGYEGLYEVSNEGRVKSLDKVITEKTGMKKRMAGRIMKPAGFGKYTGVVLCKDGDQTKQYIHRLVAMNFLETPTPERYFVNHKDLDKNNNHTSNLEWVTPSENLMHARIAGVLKINGEDNYNCKLTDQEVDEIRDLYDSGVYRQFELSEIYGIGRMQISRIVRRLLRNGMEGYGNGKIRVSS